MDGATYVRLASPGYKCLSPAIKWFYRVPSS